MLRKGEKIGEYLLLDKVGSGGFGDVWKAEKRTRVDVNHFALKFFRPKDDAIDLDKIRKEINVWKRLRGLPHIISVIELDQFDDYIYVVSDFADGGSLEKWLKAKGGKASSFEEAVKITLEVLTGLEKLHEKGFVHRDIKPDNILIMNGYHCLADFGISREIKSQSKATSTAGTMEYMPPEAFEKNASVTRQTDIWAMGVILQKLLTGSLPYPHDNQPSLIAAILYSTPERLPESIPRNLRAIVDKALQKRREDRFQTAKEMMQAINDSADLVETKIIALNERFQKEEERKKLLEYSAYQVVDKTREAKTEPLITEPTGVGGEIKADEDSQTASISTLEIKPIRNLYRPIRLIVVLLGVGFLAILFVGLIYFYFFYKSDPGSVF